ncbi:MAG: hypothetical protein VW014_00225 [Halieaceae bacterium]
MGFIPTTDTEIASRTQARTTADIFRDIGRAAAQGATLGFSDEMYGLYSELMTNKDYDTAVAEIRSGLDKFRETDPLLAYGFEIAGSILTGGAGAGRAVGTAVGREAVKRAGIAGGVEAGIYGAGTGETPEGRAMSAALSAPLGVATGAAGQAILPRVTEAATGLMARRTAESAPRPFAGYPLTPGQRLGGGIQRFEERLTSLPFTGELISASLGKPMRIFRRDAVEQALGPKLAAKLPKGLEGNELVERASQVVSQAYEDVVPQLSIKAKPVDDKISSILNQAQSDGVIDAGDLTALQKTLNRVYTRRKKDGMISKQTLKNVETDMGQAVRTLMRGGGAEANLGFIMKDIQSALRSEIASQNPDVPDLQAVNRAFSSMRPIEKAKDAAVGAEGRFTPTQALRQMKDRPAQAEVKALARQAQPIITPTTGSSGTIERGMAAQVVRDPIGSLGGAATFAPLALMYGTGPLGRKAGVGAYRSPGLLLRGSAPAAGVSSQEQLGGLLDAYYP